MPDDRDIDRYLFGRMPPAEREAFQEALLEDEELDGRVQDRENDWIDAVARGEASSEDAAALREYLAETGQEHRLRAARALERRPARTVTRWLGGAAAALVLLAASLFVLRRAAERAPAPPAVIPVVLAGAATRSATAEVTRVEIPAEGAEVAFFIEAGKEPDAAGYRFLLRGAGGRGWFETEGRPWPPDGRLQVRAPAPAPGRYEVEVQAVTAGGESRPVAFFEIDVRSAQ